MKTDKRSGNQVILKYLITVLMIFSSIVVFPLIGSGQQPIKSQNEVPQRPDRYEMVGNDTIYSYTSVMPVFTGEGNSVQKFKTDNINYSQEMKDQGIEGVVIVSFIIGKDGTASNIKITRGASPSLDAEALRVTRLMPAWKPGLANGKPVKFSYGTVYEFLARPRPVPVAEAGAPFVVVEEMPLFPGGDSALLDFILRNTRYPAKAKTNGVQGRVIVRFCVTKEGGVDRISVLKGVDEELDAEAIRVVNTLPKFKPGRQGGKDVDVWYMVPINFALEGVPAKTTTESPRQEPAGYDLPPSYPGGDIAINKFIRSKTRYPKEAKKQKISGTVLISYSIDTDGNITEVKALKGVDPMLDAEGVRVVGRMKKWEPGKLKGVPVKVSYTVPVSFKLK